MPKELPSPIQAAEQNAQPLTQVHIPHIASNEKQTQSAQQSQPIQQGQGTAPAAQVEPTSPATVQHQPTTNTVTDDARYGNDSLFKSDEQVKRDASTLDTSASGSPDTGTEANFLGNSLNELAGQVPNYNGMGNASAQRPLNFDPSQVGIPQQDALNAQQEKKQTSSLFNTIANGVDDASRNAQFYPTTYHGSYADMASRSLSDQANLNQNIINNYAKNQAAQAIVDAQQTPPQNRTDPNQYHPNATSDPFEQFKNWLGFGDNPQGAPFDPLKNQWGQAGHGIGGAIMYGLGLVVQNGPAAILGDIKNARDRVVSTLPSPLQTVLNWNPVTNIFQPLEHFVQPVTDFLHGQAAKAQSVAETSPDLFSPFRAIISSAGAIDNAVAAIPHFLANANIIHNTDDKTKPLHIVQALRGAQYSNTYDEATRKRTSSPIGIGGTDDRVPWFLDPGHIVGAALDIFALPTAGQGLIKLTAKIADVTEATRVARVTSTIAKATEFAVDPIQPIISPVINKVAKLLPSGFKQGVRDFYNNPLRLPGVGVRPVEGGGFVAHGNGETQPVPPEVNVGKATIETKVSEPFTFKGGALENKPIITPPPAYDVPVGSRSYKDGYFNINEPSKPTPFKTPETSVFEGSKGSSGATAFNTQETERIHQMMRDQGLVIPTPLESKLTISLPNGVEPVVQIPDTMVTLPHVNVEAITSDTGLRMASEESQVLGVLRDGNAIQPLPSDPTGIVEPSLVERGNSLAVIRDSLEDTRSIVPSVKGDSLQEGNRVTYEPYWGEPEEKNAFEFKDNYISDVMKADTRYQAAHEYALSLKDPSPAVQKKLDQIDYYTNDLVHRQSRGAFTIAEYNLRGTLAKLDIELKKEGINIPSKLTRYRFDAPLDVKASVVEDGGGDELSHLYNEADRVGNKYQTPEEIASHNEKLGNTLTDISDTIDKQFPDNTPSETDFRSGVTRNQDVSSQVKPQQPKGYKTDSSLSKKEEMLAKMEAYRASKLTPQERVAKATEAVQEEVTQHNTAFDQATLDHVKEQLPLVPTRVFSGDMTLAEYATQLSQHIEGTQVNPQNLVQKPRTLDQLGAIARYIPGEDGLPLVSQTVKRPFKTWKQVNEMVAKMSDPAYRRIFDRYGEPISQEALDGIGFRVTKRSAGLDGSPPVEGVVQNTASQVLQEPVMKSWTDPTFIQKKLEPKGDTGNFTRSSWSQELESQRDLYQIELQKEVAKGEQASAQRIEDLQANIDRINGHKEHPDVVSDPRALRSLQKDVLPATHVGKSDRVVQATQDWVDKSVTVSNDADHYKQAQQRQQTIQKALEDSTDKTLALPDVGRKQLGNNESLLNNPSHEVLQNFEPNAELINSINSQTMAVGTNDQGVIDSLQSGADVPLPRGQTTPSVKLESNFEVARNDAMSNTGRNHPDPTRLNNNGTVIEVKPNVSQPVEGNALLTEDIRERLLNAMEDTLDIGDPIERKALKRIKTVLHGDDSTYNDVVNAFSAYTAQAGLTSETYATKFQQRLFGELKFGGYDSIGHSNPDGTMSVELLDSSKQLPIHSQEMPQVSPIEQAGARYNSDSTRASNNPYDVYAQVDHQESATQLLARISQDSANNTASAERDLLQSTHEALDAYDNLGLEASHERAQKQVSAQQDAIDHFDALDRHLNTTSKNPCDI